MSREHVGAAEIHARLQLPCRLLAALVACPLAVGHLLLEPPGLAQHDGRQPARRGRRGRRRGTRREGRPNPSLWEETTYIFFPIVA